MHFMSVTADVGADILDLAETMITSNGLLYEPVSKARPQTLAHAEFSFLCGTHGHSKRFSFKLLEMLLFTSASLFCICLFRLFLN